MSAIGVVVVGLGIAGRTRVRDLQTRSCDLELKGFVSRRELEIPGVPQLKFEDALSETDIKAVIICTEPDTHEDLVRQSLEKGKHVLVEYPVALASATVRALYALAADKGLILHEEDIGLLTESHKALKNLSAAKKIKTGTRTLTGKFNGWVEKLPLERKPFLSDIAALQSFYDIFGDLKAVGATLDITETGFKFCGEFTPKSGNQTLYITAERFKEPVKRVNTTVVEFEDGEVFNSGAMKLDSSSEAPSGPKKPGLFMQDLDIFAAKLRGERASDQDIAMSIRCIEIAEEANALLM